MTYHHLCHTLYAEQSCQGRRGILSAATRGGNGSAYKKQARPSCLPIASHGSEMRSIRISRFVILRTAHSLHHDLCQDKCCSLLSTPVRKFRVGNARVMRSVCLFYNCGTQHNSTLGLHKRYIVPLPAAFKVHRCKW